MTDATPPMTVHDAAETAQDKLTAFALKRFQAWADVQRVPEPMRLDLQKGYIAGYLTAVMDFADEQPEPGEGK